MSGFLVALGITVLFVAGSVFALQPSPRQRQLAALRQAAVVAGLRVRLKPGEPGAEYVLGWRVPDLAGARATDFAATRTSGGDWSVLRRGGPPEQVLGELLDGLPVAVTRVSGGADGLVASWIESGSPADVSRLAEALVGLRERCRDPG